MVPPTKQKVQLPLLRIPGEKTVKVQQICSNTENESTVFDLAYQDGAVPVRGRRDAFLLAATRDDVTRSQLRSDWDPHPWKSS